MRLVSRIRERGIETEVCTAILSYAKEELGQSEIYCLIEPGNRLSVHFAKKLGIFFCGNGTGRGKRNGEVQKAVER